MDVHPTIVMVSIGIDPYPYIRNIRLIGVNFWLWLINMENLWLMVNSYPTWLFVTVRY